ncbi:hypothetical protein ABZY42_32345 [Streptomyces sp. NPDC006622]|uniref:HAD family hydrolase n=1 Tax=Streptomyces sp. NPDC006622 TaxID=3155459 RepID=UPI00339FC5D0
MRLAPLDLDGTPVDRTSALADAVADLCHDHAYGPEIERWPPAELAVRAERSDVARLRASFGLGESAGHPWRVYVDRTAATVACRPTVLDSLARLRECGGSIGAATNGSPDVQRAKVRATGLADLVDGIAACVAARQRFGARAGSGSGRVRQLFPS